MHRLIVLVLLISAPSFASITVTSPVDGTQVSSPVTLIASSRVCGGQTTTAMGYSIDQGATTIVKAQLLNALVISGLGQHVLNVKCWGPNGAAAGVHMDLNVVESIPSNAIAVNGIQALSTWAAKHDPAAGSTSSGSTALVGIPSLSGAARQFSFTYSHYGGELFHVSFGGDTEATHFVYDARVMFPGSANIANVEMDMNQVMANGQTVIYSFQCDGWTGTWDYGENAGTVTSPKAHWIHSGASCAAPKSWTPNLWHHVQIAYSRDAAGNITYDSVVFDGERQEINATVPGAFSLGWGSTLLTNFQLDGNQAGTASATAYLDNLIVYRW